MTGQTKLWMRIGNGVLFYAGWVVVLWGAGHQAAWIGVLVTFLIVALQLSLSHQRCKDTLLLIIICLIGGALDTIYQTRGVIHYESPNIWLPSIVPLWVISLYALLAVSLDYSLGWLKGRPVIAAILGSAGAVATYLAGERSGVATFGSEGAIVVIALVWVILMPSLVALSGWLGKRACCREVT